MKTTSHMFIKNAAAAALFLSLFVLPAESSARYRISGLVEFNYRTLETKIGNNTTTDAYWSQQYRGDFQGDVIDPRFMQLRAGVGYTIYTYRTANDSTLLTYNIASTFLPGMKISWDMYGYNTVSSIESSTSIVGYDVTTSQYGGTAYFRLGSRGRNGNNGRNRNNNNVSGYSLPDITLSRKHTESESLSLVNALKETRDDTAMLFDYRYNSKVDIAASAAVESYENHLTNSSYETRSATLLSTIRMTSRVDLRLSGRLTDRDTHNITGFDNDVTRAYAATVDVKEREGWRHYYQYDFREQQTPLSDLTSNKAEARISYRASDAFSYRGGVDHTISDYVRHATLPADPGESSKLETTGLTAGAYYVNKRLVKSFAFNLGYDFSSGISQFTSGTGVTSGSGMYYANTVAVAMSSTDLEKERISIGYTFNNRRDASPIDNDTLQHAYLLSLETRRIPKTSVRGSAHYNSQVFASQAGTVFLTSPTLVDQSTRTNQQHRSFTYDLGIDHSVRPNVSLSAGASRSRATTFTLATLVPTSAFDSEDTIVYAMANASYALTRLLIYRVQLREEFRSSTVTDTQSHIVNMYLDYRIRSVFVNFEYRWRQDAPDVGLKTEQQYFFAKVSRPF